MEKSMAMVRSVCQPKVKISDGNSKDFILFISENFRFFSELANAINSPTMPDDKAVKVNLFEFVLIF